MEEKIVEILEKYNAKIIEHNSFNETGKLHNLHHKIATEINNLHSLAASQSAQN